MSYTSGHLDPGLGKCLLIPDRPGVVPPKAERAVTLHVCTLDLRAYYVQDSETVGGSPTELPDDLDQPQDMPTIRGESLAPTASLAKPVQKLVLDTGHDPMTFSLDPDVNFFQSLWEKMAPSDGPSYENAL